MRRVVMVVFVLSVGVALSACGSSSPKSPRSPKAVSALIVAAALAEKSVHWEELSRQDMEWPVKLISDVSADSGMQRLIFAPGTRSVGKAEERLVDNVAYVRGDAVGLEDALYLSPARAKNYAGRWISIQRGDALYPPTADGLTLSSIVDDVTPSGTPLKLVRRKAHGTPLIVVQADAHSLKFRGLPGSLSATADGEPLPVAAWQGGVGSEASTSFSKWNEPLSVRAPASSTPIAIVRGSPQTALAAIVGAGLAQKSVRLTATVDRDVVGKRTYTINVGKNGALERVKYGGSTMRLLVYNDAVYVRGDAQPLRDRLGLNPGQARRYAGKWIWIPRKGDEHGLYAELTDGLTLATIVRRAARMKDLTLSMGTDRSNVVVVRGTPTVRALPVNELTARASGIPLPVTFFGRVPGTSVSGRLSRWNDPVQITLPESSTPIAVVRGG
jgi:hypothetical protein